MELIKEPFIRFYWFTLRFVMPDYFRRAAVIWVYQNLCPQHMYWTQLQWNILIMLYGFWKVPIAVLHLMLDTVNPHSVDCEVSFCQEQFGSLIWNKKSNYPESESSIGAPFAFPSLKKKYKIITKNISISEKICKSLGLFGLQGLWFIKRYTHLLAKVHVTAPSKLRSSCFGRNLDSGEQAFQLAKDEDIQHCRFPGGSGISREWRSGAIPALVTLNSNSQLGSWEFQVLGRLTKAKTFSWTNASSRSRGKTQSTTKCPEQNKQKTPPPK